MDLNKKSSDLTNESLNSNTSLKKDNRRLVAVATIDGLTVNSHLGKTKTLQIYEITPDGFRFVEQRSTPFVGLGDYRWINLANVLKDCSELLVNEVGANPLNILQHSGIKVIKMNGLIDEGLDMIYDKIYS